jgi:hypothetical protein
MAFGLNVVLLYAGGAALLGLIAMVVTVRAKNQSKASRERARRMRRTIQGAS